MSDRIILRDLLFRAIIGVNPDERTHRQDVLVNLELEVDTRPRRAATISPMPGLFVGGQGSGRSGGKSSFQLIERLAGEIAALCLKDPRVGE
jgi:dihydroneopterin aldolase